jgi:cytochrome o ubiquinol oxidase subunit 2
MLDAPAYAGLARPSAAVAPVTYRAVAPDLFDGVVGSVMRKAEK